MNRIPTARIVFDVKKKASKNEKGLVQIVVTLARERHYYSTGVRLFKGQWSDVNHVINTIDAIEQNDLINALFRKVNDYIRICSEGDSMFSFKKVEEILSVKEGDEKSFIDFLEERVENRPDIGEGTRKHHRVLIDALREHGKIRRFPDLTKANILDFYEFVMKKGVMATTTYNYMKNLKVYVNQAIARGLLNSNPFDGVKLDRGKNSIRTFLTEEEIVRLANADIKISPIAKARDLFIFQCYTGISYVDMMSFDYDRDVTERDGKKIVFMKRVKTGEDFYVVLMKPCIDILEKYDYKLPTMSNQNYNNYLKLAASAAGIPKSISSHSGRHSFAVMALNNGIPIEVVGKILGHADIRTTRIYAKVLNKSIEDAFEKLGK